MSERLRERPSNEGLIVYDSYSKCRGLFLQGRNNSELHARLAAHTRGLFTVPSHMFELNLPQVFKNGSTRPPDQPDHDPCAYPPEVVTLWGERPGGPDPLARLRT